MWFVVSVHLNELDLLRYGKLYLPKFRKLGVYIYVIIILVCIITISVAPSNSFAPEPKNPKTGLGIYRL
jgi:hypothetical protein